MTVEYSTDEMMIINAARLLQDGMVCFVGIGLPSTAANLARRTHAPGCVLVCESGCIGSKTNRLPLSIGDGELAETADVVVGVAASLANRRAALLTMMQWGPIGARRPIRNGGRPIRLRIPSLRLGVEAHSRAYHFGAIAEAADEDRDRRVAEQGWDTYYVGWRAATRHPAAVRASIEQVAAQRAVLLQGLATSRT